MGNGHVHRPRTHTSAREQKSRNNKPRECQLSSQTDLNQFYDQLTKISSECDYKVMWHWHIVSINFYYPREVLPLLQTHHREFLLYSQGNGTASNKNKPHNRKKAFSFDLFAINLKSYALQTNEQSMCSAISYLLIRDDV